MNKNVSITFPGGPVPEPGPIPAAAASLLRARDHGETGFAEAPRDRTLLPELREAANRLRETADELVVAGDDDAVEGALALAAVVGGPGGIPVGRSATTDQPAYLFAVKGPEDPEAFESYEGIRDRLSAESVSGWRDRVAIVTDPACGAFFEEAARAGVALFPFPLAVSAPESILTAAGVLAAGCAGAEVIEVLDDARDAQAQADAADFAENPAQRLAAALAAEDGWAEPVAGPSRAALLPWLGRLLRSHLGTGPVPGGLAICLEPDEATAGGAVLSGGSPGALVQVLLVAVDLAGRAAGGAA